MDKPALRISNIVYGRELVDGRVRYLVNEKGEGTARAIPEDVVLKRWKARQLIGYKFQGTRLSPTIWRGVGFLFGPNVSKWWSRDIEEKLIAIEASKAELRANKLKLPNAVHLIAILQACGPQNVQIFLDKHIPLQGLNQSGVPDLFLYATRGDGHLPEYCRFVEVKKPDERVSADQKAEIALLQSLSLPTRVLRLIER